jgi:hypothetical protein
MSTPYEPEGLLGVIIENLTTAVTGDYFLTLFFLLGLFLVLLMGFGLPNELNILVVLPALLVLMAFTGQFLLIGVLVFIVLSAIFARSFFLA